MDGYSLLTSSYGALMPVVRGLDDAAGWRHTRCAGWTVRDLVYHLLSDAQRGLMALHTPATGPPDVDGVSYWQSWQPGTPGADASRRATRIMASAWSSVASIAEAYAETMSAVLDAGGRRGAGELVATQGHVLTVDSLLRTLTVEATVHHLDLSLGHPSQEGLSEVRRVLDGLLGEEAPLTDTVRYVLVATGREPLSAKEADALGLAADRMPLFG